jgi:opacity protein-like surface antigen
MGINSTKETMMRINWIDDPFLLSAMAALALLAVTGSATAHAQASEVRNLSRTDVAVSLYGAFSGTTTGNGVEQSPSNSAGGMFELRHIANPILGFDATYSYNRANQTYNFATPTSCPIPGCSPAAISANAHEATGDWVPSVKIANLRPFAVLGIGLLLNVPSSGQANTSTDTKPVYVYGAGLDWGLLPHIGLRFQYRGNVHRAPDITTAYGIQTLAYSHTAEPMIGAYLRF